MSAAARVIKNTWILYARMAITVFISLYSTRLVLKELGAGDFGIFNLVGGAISMLSFLNAAMAAATQRFMSYAEGAGQYEKQVQIFNVSTILHILAAIMVFIVLEIGGMFLFDHFLNIPPDRLMTAKLVWQFMVVSTLLTIISVPYDAVINAHENMLFFAILGIIEALFKVGVALYLAITPFDKLTTFGFLTALSGIVLLMIRRIYCHQKYKECVLGFRKYFSKPIFREMASFASWSFLGSASSLITNYGQGIVLNIFFGTTVNAAQGVANQVSGQIGVFALNMQKAINPIITKSEGAGNRLFLIKASLISCRVSFFLLMIFIIPVFIETSYIFNIWLKKTPDYLVIFTKLLLCRNLIEQLYIPLNTALSAEGNIKKYQIYQTTLNFLPLIIAFILFNIGFGASSIYIIFLVYSMIGLLITIYFSKANLNLSLKIYYREVLHNTIFSLLISYLFSSTPLFFMEESLLRLIVVIFFSISSSLVSIWFVGLTKDDRKQIINRLIKKNSLSLISAS